MARKEYLFTSESVSEGCPDKIADQISDAIVDAYIEKDLEAKLDISTLVTKQKVIVSGEIKSSADVDIEPILRNLIKEIGYDDASLGFDSSTCDIKNYIQKTTKSNMINNEEDSGIDRQKLIFGFAINDSDAYMPLTITLAHSLVKKLSQLRKSKELNFLKPDSRCQITLQYDSKGKPKKLHSVVISTQHNKNISVKELREVLMETLIKKTIPNSLLDNTSKIFINPNGAFIDGGPLIEVGVSGRKTIVDTYGSWSKYGGGSLSGKDPSKVDRAASYMLRKIAKNLVAAGITQKVELQAAYAPNISKPIALYVDSFGTGKISDDKINKKVVETFDLNPLSIVKELELLKPKYQKTACYGHFGRHDENFTWEMIDKINNLK